MYKSIFFVFAVCLMGTACQGPRVKDANLVKSYQQKVEQSKACMADADCVAVAKGCCPCDGQEAVNKKYAEILAKQREKACGIGPCTLQMCYTDINVSCVNKVCTGTPKPMEDYFAK